MGSEEHTEERKADLSPMLRHYCKLKEKYPDCLLLFQVGDFYELFFEDAVIVSRALNLTLTSRDRKNPDPIPMCGVPVSVVDSYAGRLIDAGYSVAIVSQVDGPVKSGVAVDRYLERIITPGVRLLASAKQESAEDIVAAVFPVSESTFSIASSNVLSGAIEVLEDVARGDLVNELLRVSAAEIVVPTMWGTRRVDRRLQWVKEMAEQIGEARVKYRAESAPGSAIDGSLSQIVNYGSLSAGARHAVRLLVQFVDETTVGLGVRFHDVRLRTFDDLVNIDATTRDSLELLRNSRDLSKTHSLYGILDRTVYAGGSRLLQRWIAAPLRRPEAVEERLGSVRLFVKQAPGRGELRDILRFFPDFERIAVRLELSVVTPGELAALRDAFAAIPQLKEVLRRCTASTADGSEQQIKSLCDSVAVPEAFVDLVTEALVERPAPSFNDGEIIRDGFNAELDRLRGLRKHGREWISSLEQEEREKTGIQSLKLRFNQAFGFFIEITRANLHKVPSHYIRKQTTVNGERFTTEALREREQEILSAESREIRLQKDLFNELRQLVRPFAGIIRDAGGVFSMLDVLASLAEVAEAEGYTEPEILDTCELTIQEGKHPVLAGILGPEFVPNSLGLIEDEASCVVLTGPNMGGKSTFLRQNALLVVMAQIGSFVPARRARIGVVDRVFSRIGATDHMVEGDSTFMVEMREAAAIIKNASERSLVIIDEIGRGTATADGLALAQSILEWLVLRIKCRTLFATHFHELTILEELYSGVKNISVGSVEKDGKLIFTHHIRDGAASKSYGIEVAKLAGLPPSVIKRAKEVLQARQKSEGHSEKPVQQSLFDASLFLEAEEETSEPVAQEETPLERRLASLFDRIVEADISRMTPLDAMNFLNALRSELLAGDYADEMVQ